MKKDLFVITGILLVITLFYVIPRVWNGKTGAVVRVYQDNEEIESYSLWEDQTVTVTDEDGGYNLLMISSGEAFISDADCPDRLCVRQRRISGNGESIICLPHKLVIQVESDKEGAFDAVTY